MFIIFTFVFPGIEKVEANHETDFEELKLDLKNHSDLEGHPVLVERITAATDDRAEIKKDLDVIKAQLAQQTLMLCRSIGECG